MNPMKRAFVDVEIYTSRNMSKDNNIDYQFWFDKTIEERLAASIVMIETSFKSKEQFLGAPGHSFASWRKLTSAMPMILKLATGIR